VYRKNQAKVVIPSKANRKLQRETDWAHYKNRNLIELFFNGIKQFRRIATRYDKLASRFSSFLMLVAAYE
jgi:transposase